MRHQSFHEYIFLVSANDVTEHFAFPGNIDFAADDQGAFSCIIHERLLCLFIVCETMFTIGESRTISSANYTQAQQVAPNPRRGRFSTETPLERERRLEIQREQRRRRRQQESADQREHRLAQRRQRRQQETEEQRNRRLEYQRDYYQGRRTLDLNNVSNSCNSGPLSNETHEQRERRLQSLRTAQARRLANETDQERILRLQTLRQNNAIRFQNETHEDREHRLQTPRGDMAGFGTDWCKHSCTL